VRFILFGVLLLIIMYTCFTAPEMAGHLSHSLSELVDVSCPDEHVSAHLQNWLPYISKNKGLLFHYPPGYAIHETPDAIQVTDARSSVPSRHTLRPLLAQYGFPISLPMDYYDLSRTSGSVIIYNVTEETLQSATLLNTRHGVSGSVDNAKHWSSQWHMASRSLSQGHDHLRSLTLVTTPPLQYGSANEQIKLHADISTILDKPALSQDGEWLDRQAWLSHHMSTSMPILRIDIYKKFPDDWIFYHPSCEGLVAIPEVIDSTVAFIH
jgi:hypothetical protein